MIEFNYSLVYYITLRSLRIKFRERRIIDSVFDVTLLYSHIFLTHLSLNLTIPLSAIVAQMIHPAISSY